MNLDKVSDKDLHELERLTQELLKLIKKARVPAAPLLIEQLRILDNETGKARRERFDAVTPQFRGF